MPYEPLVLLHRLAPEEVDQLIRQNPPPPNITNQPQNAHTFQNNDGGNNQSLEKDVVMNNSILPLENQQKLTGPSPKLRVLKSNFNGVNHEIKLDDKLEQGKSSKEQKVANSRKEELTFSEKSKILSTDIFKKELVVVIDNCYNDVIRDMVNITAQHAKTRIPINSTVATNSNTTSSNSVASTRDSVVGKEHENIMISTSKSPLSTVTPVIEVNDKKTKEFSLNGQHINANEHDKVQYDSSGLSLRTRTISSTTAPTPLHHSTVSASNTVKTNPTTPRPRGRPPRRKNLKHIANRKALQQAASKLSEESKVCNLTTSITTVESAAVGLERLQQQQQQQMNECNGTDNYDDDQENSEKNGTYINAIKDNKQVKSIVLTDSDEDCIIVDTVCKKKSNNRKRKQTDIGETVAEKRLLKSGDSKNVLVKKNVIEKSSLPDKSNSDLVKYGFLAGSNIFEPYRQCTDLKSYYPSNLYGRTYWPTSWEYSAASLTGHVQKKTSKEALRKIRMICGGGATSKTNSTVSASLKINSTLKKYQTSVSQRRGNACKSTAVASVEVTGGSRHHPSTSATIVKRQKGRPPGRKNKLLQAVLKSNSPRKSPRQHASTLAAIMSNKDESTDKDGNEQPDKLNADVESNKTSLDMDVPCLLKMTVPNYEHTPGFRHHRHRRQLDNNIQIIKRRRRRRRSTTPPPPKLCAQQPAPQRISINTAIDQERVKLRTKHVDVVRRRARDERLRAAFVYQQLHKVQEIAEKNRRKIAQEVVEENEQNYQFSSNAIILPFESNQDQIWSHISDSNREPDNMCLQIMYEQTADKRFLCTNLTDDTLQMYYQQREIALNERLTNNCYGETVSSDFGTDMISASNKRKKKRPNMTGWPKEKRRKIIATTSSTNIAVEDFNGDSDAERDDIAKRRRAAAAEQQRLRRQRIKLEQQQLLKAKSKGKVRAASPKRRGRRPGRPCRRPGAIKKNKTATYRRNNSVSSNGTTASSNTSSATTTIKEKKPRKQRTPAQNKTAVAVSVTPNTIVKRRCGRPVGSVGRRRLKLQLLQQQQHCQNQTSSSSEQQKENVVQQQSSTGKLKCVISTRNNRMKLLSTSSRSSSATSSQKKNMAVSRTKKSGAAYNLTSSCLASLPSQVTVVGKITRTTAKRRRLQQHQQTATTTVTWDVGRPKRYHSNNHSRNANSVVVEEDCCFVGSQPFEQHCPGGGGGLNHNTVIENHQDHQKENTVHSGL